MEGKEKKQYRFSFQKYNAQRYERFIHQYSKKMKFSLKCVLMLGTATLVIGNIYPLMMWIEYDINMYQPKASSYLKNRFTWLPSHNNNINIHHFFFLAATFSTVFWYEPSCLTWTTIFYPSLGFWLPLFTHSCKNSISLFCYASLCAKVYLYLLYSCSFFSYVFMLSSYSKTVCL